MSQGRPSHSPAGPSRLPVYLTGAPMLSSSPSSSTKSPRASTSAASRFKRSSVFESFDAPAYCNDMADYISAQLAIKPKRSSKRDQEIEASLADDKWRGGSLKEGRADLADVSVQTTVDDEGDMSGTDKAVGNLPFDIDVSRTEQKMAEADAFLQQLQSQPEELTEIERDLEDQVLSFFGAGQVEESSEEDELEDSNDIQPEVAAQIAGMLAEKNKRTGPLIEEVDQNEQVYQGSLSSSSGDIEGDSESESNESDSSDEEDLGSEDEERQGPSYDERREALMRPERLPDDADELLEEMDEDDESGSDLEIANGVDLYQDNFQAQPPSPSNEAIELSSSDEEGDGHEGEERTEEVNSVNGEASEEDIEAPIGLQIGDEGPYIEAGNAHEEVTPLAALDLYSPSAVFDIGDEWEHETGQDAMTVQDSSIDDGSAMSLAQEVEAITAANLFEQPTSAFTAYPDAYSDGLSSFAPLQDEIILQESQSDAAEPLLDSPLPEQEHQEALAPHILPHLQPAESGADLLSLKQHLATSDQDISQAASIAAQPGTPQRAGSVEQSHRDTNDGNARHARDLFHIKSVAQRTLEGQASMATSRASDIGSAPHLSDIGIVDQNPGASMSIVQDQGVSLGEYAEPEAIETALIDDLAAPNRDNVSGLDRGDIADELVDYAEFDDATTDGLDERHDIDIQSFTGSHKSDHLYGQEEVESPEDRSGMLKSITEEEQEEPSQSIRDEEEDEGDAGELAEDDDLVAAEPLVERMEPEKVNEGAEGKVDNEFEAEIADRPDEAMALEVKATDILDEASVSDAQSNAGDTEELVTPIEQFVEDAEEPYELGAEDNVEGADSPQGVLDALAEKQNAENQDVEKQDAAKDVSAKEARPRRSGRSRTQTRESVSPTITRESLRKSQSRAPSEVAPEVREEVDAIVQQESPVKTASKPKRNRRSRTATAESPARVKRSLRQSLSRAVSEAASEGSPRKHRHARKSDASGDLADFVPELVEDVEEEEAPERPTKRHKVDEENEQKEEIVAKNIDEDMLDTTILEEGEEDSQMQVDDAVAGQDGASTEEAEEIAASPARPSRRSRAAARKSTDSTFRVTKVEESDEDEDKEVKLKKDQQKEERKEAAREKRRLQRDVKAREKELVQKEEKEAEKAAVGISRKARVSEDIKSFRPQAAAAEDDEEEEEAVPPKETIATRRSKRRAA